MGRNLARNFARHGHTVALHNRTQSRVDDLVRDFGDEGSFVPEHVHGGVRRLAGEAAPDRRHGQGGRPHRRGHRRARPAPRGGRHRRRRRQRPLRGHAPPRAGAARARHPLRRERHLRGRGRRARGSVDHAGRLEGVVCVPRAAARVDLRPRRRRAVLRVDGSGRRRPLRQDGPQRHRVRRHAVHRRGLRRSHGGRPVGPRVRRTCSASGTRATSTPSSSRSPPRCWTRSTRRPERRWWSASSTGPSRRAPAAGRSRSPWSWASPCRPSPRRSSPGPPPGDTAIREASRPVLTGPERRITADERQRLVDDVRDALWASKVVAYAQGLEMIRKASETYDWGVDIATVARIWRGGCIIRARLLAQISDEYAGSQLATLLVAPSIASGLGERQECVAPGGRGGDDGRGAGPGVLVGARVLRHGSGRRGCRPPWSRGCATTSAPTPTSAPTGTAPSTRSGPGTGPRSTRTPTRSRARRAHDARTRRWPGSRRCWRSVDRLGVAYSGGVDSSRPARPRRPRVLGTDGRRRPSSASRPASPARSGRRPTTSPPASASAWSRSRPTRATSPPTGRNGPDRCFHCKDELFTRISDEVVARGCGSTRWPTARTPTTRGGRTAPAAGRRPSTRCCARWPTWASPSPTCATLARAARSAQRRQARRALPGLAHTRTSPRSTPRSWPRSRPPRAAVRALGFADCRVRHHGEVARVELLEADLDRAWCPRCGAPTARRGARGGVPVRRPSTWRGSSPGRSPFRWCAVLAWMTVDGSVAELDLGPRGPPRVPRGGLLRGQVGRAGPGDRRRPCGRRRPGAVHPVLAASRRRRCCEVLPDAAVDEVARLVAWPAAMPEPVGGPRPRAVRRHLRPAGRARGAADGAHLGRDVELVVDVGVAGLHRVLGRLELLRAARVIVVVAGMDGALPSVVAGLVSAPVVAVPTSVGYGAAFEGLARVAGDAQRLRAGGRGRQHRQRVRRGPPGRADRGAALSVDPAPRDSKMAGSAAGGGSEPGARPWCRLRRSALPGERRTARPSSFPVFPARSYASGAGLRARRLRPRDPRARRRPPRTLHDPDRLPSRRPAPRRPRTPASRGRPGRRDERP